MGQGAKGPRNESSRERFGQGPIGRFAPGSELARERKGCESLYVMLLFTFYSCLIKYLWLLLLLMLEANYTSRLVVSCVNEISTVAGYIVVYWAP